MEGERGREGLEGRGREGCREGLEDGRERLAGGREDWKGKTGRVQRKARGEEKD